MYGHFLKTAESETLSMRCVRDAEADEKAQRFVAQRLRALKRELPCGCDDPLRGSPREGAWNHSTGCGQAGYHFECGGGVLNP